MKIAAVILNTLFLGFFIPGLPAQAAESIIEAIQSLRPALVIIKAENAEVYKGPDTYLKDGARLMVVNPVRVAQYSRQGGGVILDPQGIIVTNSHTIKQAGRIKVFLHDNTEYTATVISISENDDLAYLKITPKAGLISMELADPDSAQIGDSIYTVGSSETLKGVLSGGRLIAFGTKDDGPGNKTIRALLRVNFDIYEGDSGGPVIDSKGKLIGLISAGATTGSRTSLAIAAEKIRQLYINLPKSP
jgi:S1-C subfamily serine protease